MKNYIKPEMEIIELEKEDSIVTSGCPCDIASDL